MFDKWNTRMKHITAKLEAAQKQADVDRKAFEDIIAKLEVAKKVVIT